MSASDEVSSQSLPLSNLDCQTSNPSLLPRRRSSVTAFDPWGTLPRNDRKGVSTLHILKIPPPVGDTSNESLGHLTQHDDSSTTLSSGRSRRISFAGSSFGASSYPEARQNQHLHARRSSVASHMTHESENKLTPIQVCELAEQCKLPMSPVTSAIDATSPPNNFTYLPKSHYLPFIDRPSEVKELLERAETHKLFLLLAQAFPQENSLRVPLWDDPASWSHAQLEKWLTTITREEADDVTWIQKAGVCISSRSELIWEKVKEVLGVPYELEEEYGGKSERSEDHCSALDLDEASEEVWVEPIVAAPGKSPPLAVFCHPDHASFRPKSRIDRSPNRMDDISEDAPDIEGSQPASSTVQGLRVGNCSSSLTPQFPVQDSPPVRRRRHTSHMFPANFSDLAPAPTVPDRDT
ncbi:hypothetical protein BU17DRAFT_39832 [Hysterangium stoloniferum]|nr:hypothetical protein BU17DRAFT_39832 [Hysterangium stoloniferum]